MEDTNLASNEDLFKPENKEALSKALEEDIRNIDASADGTAEQIKPDEDGSESQDEEQEKKTSRIEQLLADRNAAREAAAQEAEEKLARDKRIEELEEKISRIEEGEGREETNEGISKEEIKKLLKEELDARDKTSQADKADIQDVDNFLSKNPDANTYREDMLKAMKAHPTITPLAAYKMVKDDDITPADTRRTATANRSNPALRKGRKTAGQMTTSELKSELNALLKSSELEV